MEQKSIALELLVRSGNPKGVEQFVESEVFDEARKTEKIAEAGIYSAIKYMGGEDSGCGIDSERVCQFLNQDRFNDYFSQTTNTTLLTDLISVLQSGTHVMMEAYAQITPFDVFGMESIAGAIRRNIDSGGMRERVTELTRSGYALVFCPHDIDADMVHHYFPLVDQWRDFINPQEVAAESIRDIASDCEDLFEYDYQKEFVYAALDKLIELTDRQTVSKLVYEHFGESDDYQRFIDDGKVDAYTPQSATPQQADDKVTKAVRAYENESHGWSLPVRNLVEAIGEDGKDYIAQRMGDWFRQGKMSHLVEVANFEDGRLYDCGIARKSVGDAIAEASQQGNLTRLDWALDLPNHLIDETNPAISGVVIAYRISQQTKGQE